MNRVLLAVLMVSFLTASRAQAQQPDLRDYEAGFVLPDNSVIVHTYLRHLSASGDDRDFSQVQAAFRATYVKHLGKSGLSIVPVDLLLPAVDVTVFQANPASPLAPKTALRASGIGDLTYIPTIGYGIVHNAETLSRTWFAFTPYITLPTGSYNADRFVNIGSIRWTMRPQLTAGHRFFRAFSLEAMVQMAFHGKNDEFLVPGNAQNPAPSTLTLKQDNSFGGIVHFGMDLSPTFFWGLGYIYDSAGARSLETPVGDVEISRRLYTSSLRFTTGVRIEKVSTLMLQLQPDIAASEGVTKGRFVGVRFTHAFF